ncbi:MAG TPA: tetratricopeptide repeat protein [Candidatus Acidoferrum sp.]|nr:tetratricopeptide repeat protein [Candidatus Acidoferrum sp.]
MTLYRMAVPAAVLLASFVLTSAGQVTDDTPVNASVAAAVQTPAQGAPAPGAQTLSAEEMADILMARKEYREAAISYKKLVDANPRSAIYWNKLGIALHQQEELAAAMKSYQQAVKIDPKYADAQNNIGTIWYQRKKYGKAIRSYQKALKVRSDMAVLYSNLGYAYFGDKKYEDSITAFRQALAIDPQCFDRNSSRAGSVLQDRSVSDRGRFYFLLAKSFAQAGNVDRALVYLRKAKEEGYGSMNDVKTDPAFQAMVKLPETQEILLPKTNDPTLP